jgi:transposase
MVEKVPAAYTSQACNKCHVVSPSNRKGNVFQCKVCSARSPANVNAAKNLVKRFHPCHVSPALTNRFSLSKLGSVLYRLIQHY